MASSYALKWDAVCRVAQVERNHPLAVLALQQVNVSGERLMSTHNLIYTVVRQIPKGQVATYGQVAGLANLTGKARLVGYALFRVDIDSDIPWHRVINAKGEISHSPLRRGGDYRQRSLLEQEGIKFSPEGKINLREYLWRPDPCPAYFFSSP